MSQIIKVKNLISQYGDTIVHDNISFEIKKNEIFGILGSSGSVKSTLMSQMVLLKNIYKGDIEVFGFGIKNITQKETQMLRNRSAVLFQSGALYSSLSVLENISLPLLEHTKLSSDLIEHVALTKLSMVGLDSSCAYKYPNDLSGGMRKRVSLSRALALDPELLFLDEPTSGLDPFSALAFDELIVELRNALGITVVIVTHDLDTIKTALDRFVILNNKNVGFNGTYDEAVATDRQFIKEFLKVSQ